MKNKIITILFAIAFVSIGPLMITADTPSGTLLYSDAIVEDLELIWDVTTMDATGDLDYYSDYFFVDGLGFATGHEVKLIVTEDPDTANDSWYDVYVNNIKAGDETNTSVFMGSIFMYDPSMYFITPVQYENATDTYDLYEQLFEEYEKAFVTQEIHMTQYYASQDQEMRLYGTYDGCTLTMGQYMKMELRQTNPDGSEHYMGQEFDVSWSRDVNTGILQDNLVYLDFESYSKAANGTIVDQQVGLVNYELTLRTDESPFNWIYGFVGLFAIATAIVLIKKRRR